jgi:hypothetical protein
MNNYSSSIDLEEIQQKINYVEELKKLEVEFQMYGYNEASISQIERLNGAKTAPEKYNNLKNEQQYWNEV